MCQGVLCFENASYNDLPFFIKGWNESSPQQLETEFYAACYLSGKTSCNRLHMGTAFRNTVKIFAHWIEVMRITLNLLITRKQIFLIFHYSFSDS